MQGHSKYGTRQTSHQRAVRRVRRHCTGIHHQLHSTQRRNKIERQSVNRRELEQLLLVFYDINSAVPETPQLGNGTELHDESSWRLYYKSLYCWKVGLRCWHAVREELYTFSFKDAAFLLAKSQGSGCGYANSLLCETAQGIYGAPPWTSRLACSLLHQKLLQLSAYTSCSKWQAQPLL